MPAPIWLALDGLTSGVTLLDADGTTAALPPLVSPYVKVRLDNDDKHEADGDQDFLRPHQTRTVVLKFDDPSNAPTDYTPRAVSVTAAP